MEKPEEMKPGPLCGTMLPSDKWLKVVGVYEAEQRQRKQLESELTKAKERGQELKGEYKKIRQKEKARAEKLRTELENIKQNHNRSMQKLKEKFQKQEQMALKKLEKQRELKQFGLKD